MAKFAVALGAVGALGDDLAKYHEFQAQFGGNGGEDEFRVFSSNLRTIEQLHESDPTATFSHLSPFAAIAPEEFRKRNGYQPNVHAVQGPLLDVSSVAASYDARDHGYVNAIKDQGGCGSCWAFSTVANVEGAGAKATGKLLSLSEQQLVDCDTVNDHGCQGGLPSNAFQYMIDGGVGLQGESAYPYTGSDGSCHASKSQEKAFITGWLQTSTDETQIAAALQQYGPLSIGINAANFQFYTGGVSSPFLCNPRALDHGVAIVGFGTDGGKDYWTIRNSWGTSWGEDGYIRIARGKGTCGLNTDVTTATGISTQILAEEPMEVEVKESGCSNLWNMDICVLGYQTCCLGFGREGFGCACSLSEGGSGLALGECGDCGAAYTSCCDSWANEGSDDEVCTCDVTDGSGVVV